MKITSYGPGDSANKHANIVLVDKHKFKDLEHFRQYVQGLVMHDRFKRKERKEPHYFLFSEAPFPEDYLPPEEEVKETMEYLKQYMKLNNPWARIAVSVNQHHPQAGKQHVEHSNTGYVVGAGKVESYPKMILTHGDRDIIHAFNERNEHRVASEDAWEARMHRTHELKPVFPRHNLNAGRHPIEYRICADAEQDTATVTKEIAAVSGHEVQDYQLKYLQQFRKAVMVNDSHRDIGRRVVMGGRDGEQFHLGKLQSGQRDRLRTFLTRERMRIHHVHG